jgi:hypothetical protein
MEGRREKSEAERVEPKTVAQSALNPCGLSASQVFFTKSFHECK